jgi:hypothetical protein
MIYLVGVDPVFQYVNEDSEDHPEELRGLLISFLGDNEIDLIAEDFDQADKEDLDYTEIVAQTVALDHSISHRFISPDSSECEEYDIQDYADLLKIKQMSGWTEREFEDAVTDSNGRREEFLLEALEHDLNEDSNVLIICQNINVEGLCDLLEDESYEYEVIDEMMAESL